MNTINKKIIEKYIDILGEKIMNMTKHLKLLKMSLVSRFMGFLGLVLRSFSVANMIKIAQIKAQIISKLFPYENKVTNASLYLSCFS